MIADVILGNNIDTTMWINFLLSNSSDFIIVLDYDYYGEPISKGNIIYLSKFDIRTYIKNYDTVNYYKSLYAYPGTSGNMSSYFKKN